MAEHIFFNGVKYFKDTNGYWHSTTHPTKLLHIEIWKAAHGEVPEGYEIHHVDQNKDNNALENLQCLTVTEHRRLHVNQRRAEDTLAPRKIQAVCAKCGKSFLARQRTEKFCSKECTDAWAKSKGTVSRICEYCGNEFKTQKHSKTRFCSPFCANAGVGKTSVTPAQAQEIRDNYIAGDAERGLRALAKKYHIGKSTVSRIVNGDTYKNE